MSGPQVGARPGAKILSALYGFPLLYQAIKLCDSRMGQPERAPELGIGHENAVAALRVWPPDCSPLAGVGAGDLSGGFAAASPLLMPFLLRRVHRD